MYFFLWWYHSLWSLRGKSIMKQNSSVAINSWWESHLLLIKNSNIHFLGTSCLVCLTSLATNCALSAQCFATIMSSQTLTKWLLITAFPSFFYFVLAWFCFAKIKMIKKSKHPPSLFFINHVSCLWQLATKNALLCHRLLSLLYADRLYPLGSQLCSQTETIGRQLKKTKKQNWAMRNSKIFNSFRGRTPTSKGARCIKFILCRPCSNGCL